MRRLLASISVVVAGLVLAACDSNSPNAQPVQTEVVTVTAQAPVAATAAPSVAEQSTPLASIGKVLQFKSPSGALFCQGSDSLAGCSAAEGDLPRQNAPKSRECPGRSPSEKPVAVGIFSGTSSACWFIAQWGLIKDEPVLPYNSTAIIESPIGVMTCLMEMRGVTCKTAEGRGFFASKESFDYFD